MAKNKPQIKNTPKAVEPIAPKKITTNNTKKSSTTFKLPESQNKTILFDKLNYILMAIGGTLILLGFILMSGGNTDPNVFNEAEIYSFRRITLAPITILVGFAIIAIAILKKPNSNSTIA
jgi:uncharacterized membrane protein